MTDALGHTSMTAYDADGNVTMITDPLGHTTTNSYDADNRLIRETYPDSPSDTRTYQYDAVGNLFSKTDQLGQTTAYTYNDFYYLMERDYSVGPNDQFTYDLGGRMTSATRNGWKDDYTYDGANRVVAADQNGKTVTYAYDIPHGMRTVTYPGGTNITESYDPRSRLSEINDGTVPPLTQYTYDLDDNVLSRANRNDTSTFYTYDANEWITDLIHTNTTTASLIAGFAYDYDHEGNRTFQSNQALPSDSETYAYDFLYRLTDYDAGVLSGSVIPSPSTNETYTLDAVGNWTSYTSNSLTENRTYNAVNELLKINGDSLTYDANGNLIDDGQYGYAYDVENRLIYVTNDSGHAVVGQYLYDAVGRRISVMADASGPPATTTMFYDGARIIEEQSGGTTTAVYTYGTFIDEVTTMARGGQIYYYHPNALFNIEALTDSSGSAVERYSYDAYGWPAVLDGSYNPVAPNSWGTPHSKVGNPWLFTSRQLDEESGLYYYRGRHYSATKGRFLQRDPIDYRGGFNLYEYVHSRPIRLLDPSGLDASTPSVTPPGVEGIVVAVLPVAAKVAFAKAYLAWQISDYIYSWLFYWATQDDLDRAKKAGEKLESYIGKNPCGPGQGFDAAEFKKDYDDIKKQIDNSLKSKLGAGGLSIIIDRLEYIANNITRYCKPIAANGKKDCKAMNQDFAKEYCSQPQFGNFTDYIVFWCRKNYQKYQVTSVSDCYNKIKWDHPHAKSGNPLDCNKVK
jgi:RHS repeat-associated protein